MAFSDDDGLHLMAEFEARLANRPVKGTHALATLGSTTECGGEVVTAASPLNIQGRRIACVGDLVRYPDGRETTLVCCAGAALSVDGKPLALVGSLTANGDMIVASLQDSTQIREFADERIPGLFETGYRAPPDPPGVLVCQGKRA